MHTGCPSRRRQNGVKVSEESVLSCNHRNKSRDRKTTFVRQVGRMHIPKRAETRGNGKREPGFCSPCIYHDMHVPTWLNSLPLHTLIPNSSSLAYVHIITYVAVIRLGAYAAAISPAMNQLKHPSRSR